MDPINARDKAVQLISRYKYALGVLAIGIAFMLIPGEEDAAPAQDAPVQSQTELDTRQELENILAYIDGVGKVKVMLTISEGELTRYAYDQDRSEDADSESTRRDTVIISDSGRGQQGLIEQVEGPVYLGAIVVCQGGDQPSVRLAVTQAVSNATGLGTDRITVLKMK